MYIKFKLKEPFSYGENVTIVRFHINVNDLETAALVTYLNLGTRYAPIRADNFISLGTNLFPTIGANTKVTISLKTEKEDKGSGMKYPIENAQLVCCMAKNVGKEFNNSSIELLEDNWKDIFDMKVGKLVPAPDGTLYIAPNKKGKCIVQTKEKPMDAYLSYSILFSLVFGERSYYFVLDPVVRINSEA